ncbi:MAG TPA: polysaccharide lyase 6 family protein [Blastocatellia bacterium]|nr:polysaccharide lyase 6 family protein [Blastocatellia bacterium]
MTRTAFRQELTITMLMLAAVLVGALSGSVRVGAQSGCVTAVSGGSWQNTTFAAQAGRFTAEFDATPSVSPINTVIGLSQGAQTAYAGFACLARFNPSGNIDARNGGAYAADSVIPYAGGITYHFRLAVDVPAHAYSIFVTPSASSERTVGANFAFRTEQAGVTSLDNRGAFTSTTPAGMTTVCNLTITPEAATEPPPLRTFQVSSISALQSRINSSAPGDQITVANGVYTTSAAITIARQGTAAHPIVINAATTGGVEIRGAAGFSLNSPSSFVVIRGFRFTHAIGTVQVAAGTSHCRITRNVFQLTGEGRYLQVDGDDCEVDHNTFQNKSTLGQMFSIRGPGTSGMAQRTWVHHNLFQNFTSPGGNGAETLQIGLSGKSLTDAHSLIERNLFMRCDGENELISNKSSSNVFRYNTIRDTVGELTLRHGNKCTVHSNFFINSHGLRFFGNDHQIFSNYFENCNPAIQIGNGDTEIPPGALTGHDRPDRVTVSFNTLINNIQNAVMPGRTNGLGATDLVFANNIIQSDSGTILSLGGPVTNPTYEGNIVFGSAPNGDLPASGARRINPQLVRDSSGVFRLQSTSPAINTSVGSYPAVTIDMDGQARSGAKDVGADEFSTAAITVRPLTTANVGPNAP